ncbi:hypothetical protein [Mycolicibacillus trivialis]|uniref:hypothetical protein n=1 Tax=Mycolicibacillus trivialis TaxID=1798 RepID=UPI001054835B|nr:hypothetical protein [Mycolicibacillus trivialis]
MPDPIHAKLDIAKGTGLSTLRAEAAKSAIINAALNHIAAQGAGGATADAAWGLKFDLSWEPEDFRSSVVLPATPGGPGT